MTPHLTWDENIKPWGSWDDQGARLIKHGYTCLVLIEWLLNHTSHSISPLESNLSYGGVDTLTNKLSNLGVSKISLTPPSQFLYNRWTTYAWRNKISTGYKNLRPQNGMATQIRPILTWHIIAKAWWSFWSHTDTYNETHEFNNLSNFSPALRSSSSRAPYRKEILRSTAKIKIDIEMAQFAAPFSDHVSISAPPIHIRILMSGISLGNGLLLSDSH